MQREMNDTIKLVGSVAAALLAIGSLFQATVLIVGGDFPFWASSKDFRDLKARYDASELEKHRQQCFDANRRLRNANARLAMDKTNTVEQFIADEAERDLFRINCATD